MNRAHGIFSECVRNLADGGETSAAQHLSSVLSSAQALVADIQMRIQLPRKVSSSSKDGIQF
jgi:hypothetical protein